MQARPVRSSRKKTFRRTSQIKRRLVRIRSVWLRLKPPKGPGGEPAEGSLGAVILKFSPGSPNFWFRMYRRIVFSSSAHQHMRVIRTHRSLHNHHFPCLANVPGRSRVRAAISPRSTLYRYFVTHIMLVLYVPGRVGTLQIFDHLRLIQQGGWGRLKAYGLDSAAEAKA